MAGESDGERIEGKDKMQNSRIIMYTSEDGMIKIETTFEHDTVWLSMEQMADLFQRDRSVISKHIKNIFDEGELEKNSVCAKFAHTASDGKIYKVDYFNQVQNKMSLREKLCK